MSVQLGYVDYSPATIGVSSFTPIRIAIDEDVAANEQKNIFGPSKFLTSDAKATIDLEFDAVTQTTVNNLRDALNNRVYDKKIFINEPSTYQQYTTQNLFQSGYSKSNTILSTVTTFTAGELSNMRYIDANYYSIVNSTTKYTYLFFQFDISSFIATYGVNAINRATLFLHNPYCTYFNGQDTTNSSFRILAYNGSEYMQIGEQSYTLTDVNLRAASKINQQFFSLRKVAEFTKLSNDVSTNYIKFCMVNKEPLTVDGSKTVTLGLNCVGLFLNGYAVKRTNSDNFTYRDPYTLSGLTGTIQLQEI